MYSKIPMPAADWDKDSMKYAMCFFPWVGLAIGIAEAAVYRLLVFFSAGELLTAALVTLLPVLITGGIHLDGYLDTMDALSSWREKERRLEILKDSHAGAFAVIMGGVWFVTELGAASEISVEIFPAFAGIFWVSRCFSALSVLWFPNANPKRNGSGLWKAGAAPYRNDCYGSLSDCRSRFFLGCASGLPDDSPGCGACLGLLSANE